MESRRDDNRTGLLIHPAQKQTQDPSVHRKTLKVVQPSAENAKILVGNARLDSQSGQMKRKVENTSNVKKRKIHLSNRPIEVYCDENSSTESCSEKEEHTAVHRAINIAADLTATDEPSTDYWKQMAETRRIALETALDENEQLHSKVSSLTTKVNELEEENRKYMELAEKAEALADALKLLTEDEDLDKESSVKLQSDIPNNVLVE